MIHLLRFFRLFKAQLLQVDLPPFVLRAKPQKLTTRGAVLGPDCHRMPLKVQGLRLDEMTGDGEGRVSR